jgi:hypothetical protein
MRQVFHPQLAELWQLEPLVGTELETHRMIGAFDFVPLICDPLKTVAELDVLFLRKPLHRGAIAQWGDIDNTLKTLIDSLKVPHEKGVVASLPAPTPDQMPFYCLFDDDRRITRLNVTIDHLLGAEANDRMLTVINVRVKATVGTYGNLGLAL